jgi:hypothetical protein
MVGLHGQVKEESRWNPRDKPSKAYCVGLTYSFILRRCFSETLVNFIRLKGFTSQTTIFLTEEPCVHNKIFIFCDLSLLLPLTFTSVKFFNINPRGQIPLDLESIMLRWQQCQVFKFRARARCTVGSQPHKKSHGPCKAARRRPNEKSRQQKENVALPRSRPQNEFPKFLFDLYTNAWATLVRINSVACNGIKIHISYSNQVQNGFKSILQIQYISQLTTIAS